MSSGGTSNDDKAAGPVASNGGVHLQDPGNPSTSSSSSSAAAPSLSNALSQSFRRGLSDVRASVVRTAAKIEQTASSVETRASAAVAKMETNVSKMGQSIEESMSKAASSASEKASDAKRMIEKDLQIPQISVRGLNLGGGSGGGGGGGSSSFNHGNGGDGADGAADATGAAPPTDVKIVKLTDPTTGNVYEGPVDESNRWHGDGAVLLFKDTQSKFLGRFHHGAMSHGTLISPDSTYIGPFRDGQYHTPDDSSDDASLSLRDGTVYKGGFDRGTYSGTGTLTKPDGTSYVGSFRGGKYDGRGTLKRPVAESESESEESASEDGDGGGSGGGDENDEKGGGAADGGAAKRYVVYAGMWRNGKRHGEGVETLPAGETYEGQWRDDERYGSGKLQTTDGMVREGLFKRGEPVDGPGWNIKYPNGDTYYGKIEDGKPDGMGTMKYAAAESGGGMYSGEWRMGRKHGRGIRVYAGGRKEGGNWKDDSLETPDEETRAALAKRKEEEGGKEEEDGGKEGEIETKGDR